MARKPAREFHARVEALEDRQVPGSVPYHLVPLVGRGVAVETSKITQKGGGYQVVDILNGHATDLGAFSGGVTYTVGPTGAIASGQGAVHAAHGYLLTFILTGAVRTNPPTSPNATVTDLVFQVTGGTKRFAFSSGQGQIIWSQPAGTIHPKFRIDGLINQLKQS